MKFKIQRTLFQQFLARIQGGLKQNDPMASLIVLEAIKADGGDSLVAAVSNDNLLCRAELDGSKDDSLLAIESAGKIAISGDSFSKVVESLARHDLLQLEFEPRQADGTDGGDGDDETEESGTLIIQGGTEQVKLQCIDRVFDTSPDRGKAKTVLGGDLFAKNCVKVGISVGKASANVQYANIKISMKEISAMVDGADGEKVERKSHQVTFCTTNGQQLTIAEFEPESGVEAFSSILPYDTVLAVSRMCTAEQDVALFVYDGPPEQATFEQDILYATSEIGKATYRVIALSDRFPDYESSVGKLSFISSCQIEAQAIREICATLGVFEKVRTRLTLEVGEAETDEEGNEVLPRGEIKFDKVDEVGSAKREMSVSNVVGDDIVVDVSSRHLQVSIPHAEGETMDLSFSGKHGLGMLGLGGGARVYFQPFT
jgi:hypothetical protein